MTHPDPRRPLDYGWEGRHTTEEQSTRAHRIERFRNTERVTIALLLALLPLLVLALLFVFGFFSR